MNYKSLAAHNAACNEIYRQFQDCEAEVISLINFTGIVSTVLYILTASVSKVSGLLRTYPSSYDQMHKGTSKLSPIFTPKLI